MKFIVKVEDDSLGPYTLKRPLLKPCSLHVLFHILCHPREKEKIRQASERLSQAYDSLALLQAEWKGSGGTPELLILISCLLKVREFCLKDYIHMKL